MFQHLRQQGGGLFSLSQSGLARPATVQGLVAGRTILATLLLISASACATSNDAEKPSLNTDAERERRAESAGVVDSERLEEEAPLSKKAGANASSQSTASTKQKANSDKHPKLPPAPNLTKQAAVEKPSTAKTAATPAHPKTAGKHQGQAPTKSENKTKATAAAVTATVPSSSSQSAAVPSSVVSQSKMVPTTGRTRRTVSVQILNVRSHPNTKARIVGRLTRGTQLPVAIEGHWAKIGENQYVLAKFLRSGS